MPPVTIRRAGPEHAADIRHLLAVQLGEHGIAIGGEALSAAIGTAKSLGGRSARWRVWSRNQSPRKVWIPPSWLGMSRIRKLPK